MFGRLLLSASAAVVCTAAFAAVPAEIGDVRLKGFVGNRLESCMRNHVATTDVGYLTDCFFERTVRNDGWWRTEYWGKFMHAAAPLLNYLDGADFAARVEAGVDRILASQSPDGYIGEYVEGERAQDGWDVWGMEYTLMGLIHFVDSEKLRVKSEECDGRGKRALEAAKRLCDYVIGEVGPGGKRELWTTGKFAGLPSCSILEPVVWLYKRTKERKYLDFADYIVRQMSEPEHGPRLIDLALKGVPVCERWPLGDELKMPGGWIRRNRRKAYEQLSCYQGLLEYYEVTGRRDCFEAALRTAEELVRDEIFVTGSASTHEQWFRGARNQHLPYRREQETCVTITWMRFCEKLLALTGESRWADKIERSFYNAYLAGMRRDGGTFAAYTPLNGSRSEGHDHCCMHTDCCNANGPRGMIAFLRAFLMAEERAAVLNFYGSGRASVVLPGLGEKVTLEQYSLYPKKNHVWLWNRTKKALAFALKLRIPPWSAKTRVTVNGEAVANVRPGGYLELDRTWKEGDLVEIDFDLSVRMHRLDHAVAFTRGPVVLARETRSGDVGEVLYEYPEDLAFSLVRNDNPDVWITCAAVLPFGMHTENPDGQSPAAATFVDYASAGNDWTSRNQVRTWFPVERIVEADWPRE